MLIRSGAIDPRSSSNSSPPSSEAIIPRANGWRATSGLRPRLNVQALRLFRRANQTKTTAIFHQPLLGRWCNVRVSRDTTGGKAPAVLRVGAAGHPAGSRLSRRDAAVGNRTRVKGVRISAPRHSSRGVRLLYGIGICQGRQPYRPRPGSRGSCGRPAPGTPTR